MADDPNKPLGDRDRVEREVNARVGYGWIWIWIAIIIILVIWFGGFGWGGYGGWWWGNRPHAAVVGPNPANGNAGLATNGQPAPAGEAAAVTGSGVQILAATNKRNYVNQPFAIRNVPVQKMANDRAFWIGANDNDTMLVVLAGSQNSAANSHIQNGVRVNLSGTVERAPSAEHARKIWSLGDDAAKRLEQQGVYVQATQVQVGQAGQQGQQSGQNGQGGQP